MNRLLAAMLPILSLMLAGCTGADVYYSMRSEMVVVNDSSHTVAVGNADTGLDFEVAPGEEYVHATDRGADMWWFLELTGERCQVVFDNTVQVWHTPGSEHSICDGESFVKEILNEFMYNESSVYTYTFTDADYEWALLQDTAD